MANSFGEVSNTGSLQRDILAVSLFALAAGTLSFWNSGRACPLVDVSFVIENAYRIVAGQRPYSDFGLMVTPGSFLIAALLIKLDLPGVYGLRLYAAAQAAGGVALTYAILRAANLYSKLPSPTGLLVLLPAVFGLAVIFPWPHYNNDSTFWSLVALLCVALSGHTKSAKWRWWALAGVAGGLSFYCKQTTGTGILLGLGLGAGLRVFLPSDDARTNAFSSLCAFVLGTLLTLFVGFGALAGDSEIFSTAMQWLLVYPSQADGRRLLPKFLEEFTGLKLFVLIAALGAVALLQRARVRACAPRWFLQALPWVLPPMIFATILLAFALNYSWLIHMVWPMASILALFVLGGRLLRTHRMENTDVLLLGTLAAARFAFLSHGAFASIDAAYCWLPILCICLLPHETDAPRAQVNRQLLSWGAIFVGCAMAVYTITNTRLSLYIPVSGTPQKARSPALTGLATPGPFAGDLDELIALTSREIPAEEAVLFLPGEDPFYFATKREPQLSINMMGWAVYPYSDLWVAEQAELKKIPWVIVKREFQSPQSWTPLRDLHAIEAKLEETYELHQSLRAYHVYRRSESADFGLTP